MEDFNRTAILNIVKRHAKWFIKNFKSEINEILDLDSKILDNIFKIENKKKLKRKYH